MESLNNWPMTALCKPWTQFLEAELTVTRMVSGVFVLIEDKEELRTHDAGYVDVDGDEEMEDASNSGNGDDDDDDDDINNNNNN